MNVSNKECEEFVIKELEWLEGKGYKNTPYAKRRISVFKKLLALLKTQAE